ncbi:FAD-dependent oxidoreductase [Geosporobacter ferrireducens]|uniref:Pyridine nucleotide-disulfide oxidoreductase n=1 Tax=Geosporobacter ferrireducens TaxID=1424294 RepID=A0A1D8GEQ8_9FIRM|nr:FAD-dependent oxidoreductase [Geosporobacter ferrireducens]AOT69404.1 pyridine nucleotide-disulfide oxidoreductase [Geosporobacter ferrireducens]MTI56514.1 FAD-binding protein [Geosporobacter ferrireducens]
MQKKVEKYDVVIIGGGAAGLTAGIYCGRARLKTLIIEKSLVGGLATYTNEIENYPGFPEGTTGLGLMDLFHKQAKKFGVSFKLTDVKGVQLAGETKIVETFRTNYEAKVVIVASGGKPRLTGAKGEADYLYDKGISFCATCDAAANTDKTVLVVGSGDAAIEEGMFLTKFAKKVIVSVLHDVGKMDCNEIAKEQALSNPKMEFIWNTVVEEFAGEGHLQTVILKNLKTNERIPVEVDSCFLFIGYLPNTEIFKDILDMNRGGYLITNEKMETNIEGVFAVGDVRDKFLKQVATAVGDGAIAGFGAEKYIAESELFHQQIMKDDITGIIYIYNAVDPKSREYLTTIEKMEEEYKGKARFTKVDIYKSAGIANRLGVKDVPCIVMIKDGKISEVFTDGFTENEIAATINKSVLV